MNKIIQALKERWQYYFIEAFVITFGILLAFSLNTIKESWVGARNQKILQIEALTQVKTDLMLDIAKFDYWENNVTEFSIDTIAYNYISTSSLSNTDSLRTYIYRTGWFLSFEAENLGYGSINSNNRLSNKNLSRKIVDLYEGNFDRLNVTSQYDTRFILDNYNQFQLNFMPAEEDATDEFLREMAINPKFKRYLRMEC